MKDLLYLRKIFSNFSLASVNYAEWYPNAFIVDFVSIKQKLIFRSFKNWSEKAINIKILWVFSRL